MNHVRVISLLSLLILLGCSSATNSPPTQPDLAINDSPDVSGHPCPETPSNRTLLTIGTIQVDPETLEATFLPDREALKHWDVTPMLMPPNCNDCVKIEVLEFKLGQKYIKLKIALKNPSGLTGYDVRGIAIIPSADVRLLNSDGWTELWDDGGDVTRNPFKAFATNWPDRQIEPGTAHARVYEFTFKHLPQLAGGTQLVVDGSWPGHCREAYAFNGVQQNGFIDGDTSTADFDISLTPQDWQGDVSVVLVDLTEIVGSIEPMVQNGNTWEYTFTGPVTVPDAPHANIWVEVVDSVVAIRAFWLFELKVIKENPSLPLPEGINAAPGEVYVDITWDEINDPDVAGVNIYRRGKGESYNFSFPLNLVPVKSELFQDSKVVRNVMYYYVLRSTDSAGGIGPISEEVGAKPFEWGEQFRLSDQDGARSLRPDIAVGSDGLTRVVWRDYRPGSKYAYIDILEIDHSPDIAIFNDPIGHSVTIFPKIAIGNNNIPYVYGGASVGGDWDIIIHHLDENFIPNQDFAHFGDVGPMIWPGCACVDDDGVFWVAYQEQLSPATSHEIFIRSLSPEGVLSDATMISSTDYFSSYQPAGLAIDTNGELHCAFFVTLEEIPPPPVVQEMFYTYTIDGIWQPPEQATDLPDYATTNWQRIDVDSQGSPYIIYASGKEAPLIEMVYRDEFGWSEPINILPGYPTCSSLAITIDDDDNINVFASPYGLPYEIGFRRGYNGSWSPTYQVTQGFVPGGIGIMSFQISADCSPSGAVSLVWEQGESHIYARRMLE